MQIHVYDHAQQVGQAAATLLAAQLISKPNSVLGLATGSTPIPTYQALISLYKAGVVDFSSASSFNLDEYVGLPAGHPCSYHSFMREQLFDHVNMPADHIHIPDGNAADPQTECARYDQAITAAGGIDMQVLGIGRNGHIGFNEPDDHFTCDEGEKLLLMLRAEDGEAYIVPADQNREPVYLNATLERLLPRVQFVYDI